MKSRRLSLSSVTHVSDSEPEGQDAGADASFKRSLELNVARSVKRYVHEFQADASPVGQSDLSSIRSSPESRRSNYCKGSPNFSYISETSCALSDASFDPSPKAEFRQDMSQMPVELWTMVAAFASRSSVACLCRVSRHFYSLFNPMLYRNTIHPPLTAAQTSLFVQTLASKKPASGRPHPALLVRELGLTDTPGSPTILNSSTTISKALKRLHLAEELQVLHWSLAAGVDDLGKIFGGPGRFPHLRELAVSCKGTNNNFHFIRIPKLEVLRLDINLGHVDVYGYDSVKDIYKLSESLGMLASSSPHLHTLGLNLKIPFFYDEFPNHAYSDLLAAVNGMYLHSLKIVELCFDPLLDDFYEYGLDGPPDLPEADLSPFLESHPNLTHLRLHALKTKLTEENSFLPQLRCFQGSFRDASVLCARPRQLQNLVLRLLHFDCMELMPSFEPVPLPAHDSLTHLRVFAEHADGKPIKILDHLPPTFLQQLVSSFPNLTHLDITISQRMTEYHDSLIMLTQLKKLCVHEYRTRKLGPPNWPAVLVFPAEDYIRELSALLPSLTQLANINIHLLGDTHPDSDDLEVYYDYMDDPPQMTVNYYFSVLRPLNGPHIVLDRARVR
ncbi:hypothetical protein MSAN_01661200 [Mycena sanguinolenta]|uniref:F-box domain-containing protein n=1 Tax=Mycena sanguinolenta TaxID=230812 RepID=A0A8H6Y3D4_9AGAR|nr:hypothetical protein MSAN_01661200 [Mycena sanguinolenta]